MRKTLAKLKRNIRQYITAETLYFVELKTALRRWESLNDPVIYDGSRTEAIFLPNEMRMQIMCESPFALKRKTVEWDAFFIYSCPILPTLCYKQCRRLAMQYTTKINNFATKRNALALRCANLLVTHKANLSTPGITYQITNNNTLVFDDNLPPDIGSLFGCILNARVI